MSCYKVESLDKNCPLCQMTVNGITRFSRLSVILHHYKNTNCCGKLKVVHHKCAIIWSSKIDSTYEFDASIYEDDQEITLLCMKYCVKCFHCNQKNPTNITNVNVLLCKTCKIIWCYCLLETTKKNLCNQMSTYGKKTCHCIKCETK